MAGQNPPGGLAATARSFTPSQVQITAGVLDATFVTNTLPDINQNAGIVGICLVPEHRADPTDMGWHISDFLAFKTLLCGENHPKAQTWLSLCDIPKLVEQNPEHYAHGKERRNVSNAALVHTVNLKGREVERTDNLQVITSPEDMKTAFLGSITDKAKIASNFKIPLVIIVCGLTTVDQDFYFGKTEASEIFRISQLRDLLADDIDTMVITSAQFSAGWQINPSFIRSPVTKTRAKRDDFLARQTSGVFARSFADQFGTWKCPLLQPNASEQVFEKFPGRARQNEHQKALKEAMETKVVSLMTGRLSAQHQDHSFNFDQAADDWEVLMGPRRYRSLEELKVKWEQHQTTGPVTPFPGSPWSFLGSAFGGNKMSQMMHMQHLVFDARLSWPSYWALRQAAKTMQAMLKVLNDANPEEIKCHELFNALEHRATLGVLVDLLVRYAGLATPLGQRARDWEENRWSASATPEVIRMYNKTFGVTTDIYPGPAVPPGLNVNNLSPIQRRLDAPALYLAAALVTRFLMPGGGIQRLGFLVEGCK
ncbi:hypothetical protein F4778DRAFT_271124 [Xylariomycetidae sp. FL2044]|nr:hypothetical protein F4778DRAFT_271124 [Xylariomycetidae sp. FL2044]